MGEACLRSGCDVPAVAMEAEVVTRGALHDALCGCEGGPEVWPFENQGGSTRIASDDSRDRARRQRSDGAGGGTP